MIPGRLYSLEDFAVQLEKEPFTCGRGIRKKEYQAGIYVWGYTAEFPQHETPIPTKEEAIACADKLQEQRNAKRAEKKAQKEAEAKAQQERKELIAQKGPLATPRQINFIMQLIHEGKHREGGIFSGPLERDGVAGLSKKEASLYITSLLGDY